MGYYAREVWTRHSNQIGGHNRSDMVAEKQASKPFLQVETNLRARRYDKNLFFKDGGSYLGKLRALIYIRSPYTLPPL